MSIAEIAALLMRPPGKKSPRKSSCQIHSMFRDPSRSDGVSYAHINSAQSGLLSPRDAKLAQTVYAFVRLYFNKGIVALTVVYGKRFHIRYFHVRHPPVEE